MSNPHQTQSERTPQRPRTGQGPGAGPGAMSVPPEKPTEFWPTLSKLFNAFGKDRYKLIIAAVLSIFAVGASVLGPKVMARATNKLSEGVIAIMKGKPGAAIDFDYIGQIVLVLITLYLMSALVSYIQQRITVSMTQELVRKLRNQVSAKLDRLPLAFFDKHTHGELLARTTIDIDLISTNLQQVLSQTLSSLFTLIGIIIMMFTISWELALVSLIAIPLTFGITMLIAPRSQKFFARQQKQLGEINGQIEESFSGHEIIKTFNQEAASVAQFASRSHALYDSAWKAQFMSSVMMPLINFLTNLQYVVIVVVAAIMATSGRILIGDILAFIQYVQQFGQPMAQTAQIANVIQGSIAAAERVFSLLEEDEQLAEPADSIVLEASSVKGHVVLRDVSFSYHPDMPLIQNLNLEARPGQTVAIVGPTGSGKTTIVNLLMRFYDVQSGTIEIDGVDTSTIKRPDVRSLFGMVLQDTWLFGGTIHDNIAYGRPGSTRQDVEKAAQVALADHFIRTLPHGYDTVLGEDATTISVGQKQLITIARAVLADAPMLILDEATSSVDTRTERLIQKAMNRLMAGRTSFVIAHRLSTIKDADIIVVMEGGSVVESGTHDDLLRTGGHYAELYYSQFEVQEDVA